MGTRNTRDQGRSQSQRLMWFGKTEGDFLLRHSWEGAKPLFRQTVASSEQPVRVRRTGPPPTRMKEGEGRTSTEGPRNALSRQESALLCSACSYSPVISECVRLWWAPVPVGGRRNRRSGAQGGRQKNTEKKQSRHQKTNFWAMTPCKLVRNFFLPSHFVFLSSSSV